MSLKSTTQIISQDVIDKKLFEEIAIKRQAAYMEELKKANKPTQIFLSVFLRKLLEDALLENNNRYNDNDSNNDNNDNNDNSDDINKDEIENEKNRNSTELIEIMIEKIKNSNVFHSEEFEFKSILANINSREQSECAKNVLLNLRKQGFSDDIIYNCWNSVLFKRKSFQDEILNAKNKNKSITVKLFEFEFFTMKNN